MDIFTTSCLLDLSFNFSHYFVNIAGVRQHLKSTFSSDIVKQTAGALYEGIHIIYQSIPLWRILFTDGPQAALVTERSMMFIRDVFIFLSPWYTSKKAKETKDKSVVALELQ